MEEDKPKDNDQYSIDAQSNLNNTLSFFEKVGPMAWFFNATMTKTGANRTNVLGSLKAIHKEFENECMKKGIEPSTTEWAKFYNEKYHGIQNMTESIEKMMKSITEVYLALQPMIQNETLYDFVKNYVKQVVYSDTHTGFHTEALIMKDLAKRYNTENFRLSTQSEERKGIDFFIDGQPYQVKPESFRMGSKTAQYGSPVGGILIYYRLKETLKGTSIEYNIEAA